MRASTHMQGPTLLAALLGLSLVALGTGCDNDTKLRVSHLSPSEGPSGKKVVIYGSGFQYKGMKRVEVFFGDYRAEKAIFDGDDKIIVVAPSGPKMGSKVKVLVNFIGRGSVSLEYTYKLPPRRMTAGDLVKKKGEKGQKKEKNKK